MLLEAVRLRAGTDLGEVWANWGGFAQINWRPNISFWTFLINTACILSVLCDFVDYYLEYSEDLGSDC
jgi:hypothetical protein